MNLTCSIPVRIICSSIVFYMEDIFLCKSLRLSQYTVLLYHFFHKIVKKIAKSKHYLQNVKYKMANRNAVIRQVKCVSFEKSPKNLNFLIFFNGGKFKLQKNEQTYKIFDDFSNKMYFSDYCDLKLRKIAFTHFQKKIRERNIITKKVNIHNYDTYQSFQYGHQIHYGSL